MDGLSISLKVKTGKGGWVCHIIQEARRPGCIEPLSDYLHYYDTLTMFTDYVFSS